MKGLTKFTIFLIILVTLIIVGIFTYTCILNGIAYSSATTDIEKTKYLTAIIQYLIYSLLTLISGFSLAAFLYQVTRIADNTEKH